MTGLTAKEMSAAFRDGFPTNQLEKAGLLIHCFDETEDHQELWRPCISDWCRRFHFDSWWSASVINAKQPRAFGNSGIVFAPKHNKVLCSSAEDMGSMYKGCKTRATHDTISGPNQLKEMLEASMSGGENANQYNEVLIDSRYFMKHLPGSIAGVIYGLKGMDTYDQVKAVQAYVNLLDTYNLTERDVPLLKIHYKGGLDVQSKTNSAEITDESASAREFLRTHPYEKYRKKWIRRHPYLARHPEQAHDTMVNRMRRRRMRNSVRVNGTVPSL
jgi:hypothetical protein